ncbi:MAG TPA: tetratricopeptide repeat-containing serine protease family protein [Nitrososphaeraceae archaeon]|nr:tetratricopeptide repeat-containing serine protease family protein [Nitrososphaeraceae archaeon]
MGQTAEDIRDNIVKITDENGNCVGTGFFIRKEYCVTCHHNICPLEEIYVEREEDPEKGREKRRYHAEWIEEFSDMQKDTAFLKVQGADFKPLEYRTETYGNIPVVVRGFPLLDLYNFPDGKDERGTLADIPVRFRWKEEEIVVVESQDKKKNWNIKPEVDVYVYAFNGKFHVGFSGAPVCYQHDWKIVGMFAAKDDNQGYIIPMNIVSEKLPKPPGGSQVLTPSHTLDSERIVDLGNTYYEKHEYTKAIEQYNIILNDANYVRAWYNKGLALENLGKHQEAIACYDKALEIDPNAAPVCNNKGNALANMRQYGEAIACYDKALEIDPNYVDAWYNKGIALANLRKYEEAIKQFDEALKLYPDYVDAWTNKGNTLLILGKYEEAIKCIKEATKIKSKYVNA